MKKFVVLLILLLLLIITNLYSQQQNWTWQNPLPQGNDLKCINVINENLIFAVGRGGTIMKTTDAANNWSILNTGTTKMLENSKFLQNGLVGYAVGGGSSIIKTTDGGTSWQNLTINQ